MQLEVVVLRARAMMRVISDAILVRNDVAKESRYCVFGLLPSQPQE